MKILEIVFGIIESRKYLTPAEKNKLQMDIKFSEEIKSKLKEEVENLCYSRDFD